MPLITYISFAVSPVILVIIGLYLNFKFSLKSFANIRNAILLGMIGVVFLVIASYLIEMQWHGSLRNMRRMSFFVFIIIAFSSELAKFLILRYVFYKVKAFKGPLEGVLYAIFISLGFATVASILYAYGIVGAEDNFNKMTLFLFTYPLASITLGVVMGFFIGMGKLRTNRFIDSSTGLFASTFFHGLFYFCFITTDIRLLYFTAIGFLIITISLVWKSVNLRANKV
jgi:RsiW-degrading membrane proteinase PrsW (M82 family)